MTTIRTARSYDAPAIAELCGELGYPSTRQQMVKRLAAIEGNADGRVFVAEDGQGRVIAWLQVALATQLCDDACAQVTGFVVAQPMRGQGIGGQLIAAAEAWARTRGAQRILVRSRVERECAHQFYERAGYARLKTQLVFSKALI